MTADHLLRLKGSDWCLWRTVCVRGAGFPAADVLALADPRCADAADRGIASDDEVKQLWHRISDQLDSQLAALLDQLRQRGIASSDAGPLTNQLRQLRRAVKAARGRRITDDLVCTLPDDQLQMLRSALSNLFADNDIFERAYAAAQVATSDAIRMVARDERYREAITWQNQGVVHSAIDGLAKEPAGQPGGTKQRQREALLANYVQRYCTKNDTIGFFGPVAWATLFHDSEAFRLTTGPQLLERRQVFFEDWPVTALAKKLSDDPQLRPWFVPRRMPFLRVDSGFLHLPAGAPIKLGKMEAVVLDACDGFRTSRQIAATLLADTSLGFRSEKDVFWILEALRKNGRITWGFEAPVSDLWPERHLRGRLDVIEDEELRMRALRPLDELEAARERLAHSAGQAQRVDEALADLNSRFTQMTGAQATRNHGQTYGARALAYEDCRRHVAIDIGAGCLAGMQGALDLVLRSAQWYMVEAAQAFDSALRRIFEGMRAASAGPSAETVDLPRFWLSAQALFYGQEPLPVAPVDEALKARWEGVLQIDEAQRQAHFTSGELREAVEAAFPVLEFPAGWRATRHHSPDLMLAASSVDDIVQGNLLFVLGELHQGVNTLLTSLFFHQHPSPAKLLHALQRDRACPRVVPLMSREGTGQPIRTQLVTDSTGDVEVCFSHNVVPLNPRTAIDIADLVVCENAGVLVARTRDGARSFELSELFEHMFSYVVADRFHMLRPRRHSPRITIDKLVVRRESWRVPCREMGFAFEGSESTSFLQARRWIAELGIPRFAFVKLASEKKPFYVDFASPLYVRMLSKHVRNLDPSKGPDATDIFISEMLPSHDQLWLTDARGRRYASELRMVAIASTHVSDIAPPSTGQHRI